MEENQEIKNNKSKEFLKNNLPIILILCLGFAIRVYYFILTKNQAEWYDSGEYLSMASHWAFNLPYEFNSQRPPLFPLMEALFLKLGFGDNLLKFIVEVVPSTLLILISYLIVKEMYNKKLALLTSFFISIFWLILFNTVRLHADIPLLFFSYLAVYYFWKGYVKKERKYHLYLAFIFLALAFLIKLTAGLFGIIFLIFLILTDKLKFLKDKHLWISFVLFCLILLPYFIWQNNTFGSPTAFLFASHVTYDPGGITSYKPIGWYVLNWIPWMLHTPYFILFLIGLITLYTLFLSLDLILKNKSNEKYNDLLIFLWILLTLTYFIFLERDAEDRWLLPIALPLLILVSKGLYFVYDLIKKYQKQVAVSVFIILILIGGYFQLARASETINDKKDSYKEVRESSLWIKENSNPDDIIFSKSLTQVTYYAQRQVFGFGGNETEFKNDVKKYKPKYIVFSIFEPHGITLTYPEKFKDSLEPVKAYYAGDDNTKYVLVIYKFKNYDL